MLRSLRPRLAKTNGFLLFRPRKGNVPRKGSVRELLIRTPMCIRLIARCAVSRNLRCHRALPLDLVDCLGTSITQASAFLKSSRLRPKTA